MFSAPLSTGSRAVYGSFIKLCMQQAEDTKNHGNANIRKIGKVVCNAQTFQTWQLSALRPLKRTAFTTHAK